MDYSNYYEDAELYGGGAPKKKRGFGFGALIITAIASFLIGAMAAAMFYPSLKTALGIDSETTAEKEPIPTFEQVIPKETESPSEFETPTPAETPAPSETPAATSRPMPELDGETPDLSSSEGTGFYNPIPDIVEATRSGVAAVEIYEKNEAGKLTLTSSGSGFVISKEGYLLTNAHVVSSADAVEVTLSDGTSLTAEVVGYDKNTDVAVLKIDPGEKELTALKIGDSDSLRVGDFVLAIGDPTVSDLSGTTTFGIVSALNREVNLDGRTNEYIQTDAAINPGNSGGPLLNMSGEVIGITSAKTVTAGYDEYGNDISAEGIGFAIPMSDIMPIVEQLITEGGIVRPGIGISVLQVTEEEAEAWDVPLGIMVYSVTEDGPGDKAGLQKYDVITECDGIAVTERDEFIEIVQSKGVGETVTFKVYRNGKTVECTLTIADLNTLGETLVEFDTVRKYGF